MSNLYEVTISYLRSEKYTGVLEGASEDDIRELVVKQARDQNLLRPKIEEIKMIPEEELQQISQSEELLSEAFEQAVPPKKLN